ncbi:cell wall hydrolase [uncultured Phenylobacterium sp.]|uniref:cell wall hydrolase n=1 Tax=uncultured Phenylobacterium sp. TaxID=349273 RepID=UPI0025D8A428|nr:cell wall hydrolase [uncultured Phenylobacterium sp.]
MSAALLGSSAGLGLGAIYMNAGLARHSVELAAAQRTTEFAANSRTRLEGHVGKDPRVSRHDFDATAGVQRVANRFVVNRPAAKPKRRADLDCLTEAVYYEARSEDVRGQVAVAQVVLNRVKHPAYPKSVCAVVFQGSNRRGCQFSFACDGSMRSRPERAAWDEARSIAARVLAGNVTRYVGSATHYHTTAVSPFWAPHMARVAQVGAHVFYKFSPRKLRAAPTDEPAMAQVMLVSLPAAQTLDLQVSPAMEEAIEASIQPPTPDPAQAVASPKPAEAAMLTAPQPVSTAGS